MQSVTVVCVLQISVCDPVPWYHLVLSSLSVCWVAGSPLHSGTKVECVTQCRLFQRHLGTLQHKL